MARRAGVFAFVAFLASVAACNEPSLQVGYDDLTSAGRGGGGASGSGGAGAAGGAPCQIVLCDKSKGAMPYKCGDCIDNDGDSLIDAKDPECTGPCDNDEAFFAGELPGQSGGGCQRDCYFDGDSGNGNDKCDWSFTCDELSVGPSYPPSGDPTCAYEETSSCALLRTTQEQRCADTCLPITPNGCDCFGCCELPARSNNFVWLGSTRNGMPSCDLPHALDRTACEPCTQVPSCLNPCDDCEVCAGTDKVGPRCTGTTPLCSFGTPCGPQKACAADTYCISGCCIEVPL